MKKNFRRKASNVQKYVYRHRKINRLFIFKKVRKEFNIKEYIT